MATADFVLHSHWEVGPCRNSGSMSAKRSLTARIEGSTEPTKPARAPEPSSRDPIGTLADAVWPHIRARLDDYLYYSFSLRNSIPNNCTFAELSRCPPTS